MGIGLTTEVWAYQEEAPGRLTMSELLVLLAIAEKASDKSRVMLPGAGEPPHAVLLARTGLTKAGLARVFRSLAKRPGPRGVLDVRVRVEGKDGRAFYARAGHASSYRVPHLTAAVRVVESEPSESIEGGSASPLDVTDVNPAALTRVSESEPLSVKPSEDPSAAHARAVVEEDELHEAARLVAEKHHPRVTPAVARDALIQMLEEAQERGKPIRSLIGWALSPKITADRFVAAADRRHGRPTVSSRSANRCPVPGHTGRTGLDADGDPLCGQCVDVANHETTERSERLRGAS